MSLTLFGTDVSQPTRSIVMYLALLHEKYDYKLINLMKKEHKTEEFKKINPTRLVPAIRDGDFCLGESGAILLYLAQTRNDQKYYSSDPKVAAKINAYMFYHQSGVRPKTAPVFAHCLTSIFGPYLKETREQAIKNMEEAARKFENLYLSETKYVAGNQLTIADLMAVTEFQQLCIAAGYNFKEKFPILVDWMNRVLSVPEIKELALEKEILEYMDMFGDKKSENPDEKVLV